MFWHEVKVIDRVRLRAQQLGLHRGIVRSQDASLGSEPPDLLYDHVEGGDLGGLIGDWHGQAEWIEPLPDASPSREAVRSR